MQSLDFVSPVTTALVVATLGLSAGCAATPPSPLQAAQNDAIRRLTLQCYWNMQGERMLFGGWQVHTACRNWAQQRVEVRVPPNAQVMLD